MPSPSSSIPPHGTHTHLVQPGCHRHGTPFKPDPNLQNIPVRGEDGKEIRRCFIPEPGCLFFSADYSQIELRVMAHLSGDENMTEALPRGSRHAAPPRHRIYKEPIDSVSRNQRTKAKRANFGIIYGITVFGLAERLEIKPRRGTALIDGYFDTSPVCATTWNRQRGNARARLRRDVLPPPPLPARHHIAQRHRAQLRRTQRHQRTHTRLGSRHHQDSDGAHTPPVRRRRHSLKDDSASTRRTQLLRSARREGACGTHRASKRCNMPIPRKRTTRGRLQMGCQLAGGALTETAQPIEKQSLHHNTKSTAPPSQKKASLHCKEASFPSEQAFFAAARLVCLWPTNFILYNFPDNSTIQNPPDRLPDSKDNIRY